MTASDHAMHLWPARSGGTAAASCVLNVFESLGYGVFLLSRRRQVLAHNRIARDCLGDGLTLRGERVAATDRESDMRLQSVIGTALQSAHGSDAPASVGVRRDPRLPLVIHVLHLGHHARPVLNSASLLLVACNPERREVPPANMLADIFKLTPAEASVATGIAAGKQLAEIASDRGVKIETVRVHSKMAFAKTRTRGQAELAALLTRLAFSVPYRGRATGHD